MKRLPKRDGEIATAAADFIRIWQTSKSVEEVSKRSGNSLRACYAKAWKFRTKNVPLKRFIRQRPKLDYAALARLAESYEGKNEKGTP